MNRKFISKSNLVLRKVLNSTDNLDIIKNFIETFLSIEIVKIRLNPYLQKRADYLPAEENFGIADVRILTKEQEEYNIGIQIIDGFYVQNKLLLYYAQIHTNQLLYEENKKIAKTITINILDFNYFKSKEYHKKIFVKNPQLDTNIIEKIEMHIIELTKFSNNAQKDLTNKSAWMNYLVGKNPSIINTIKKEFVYIRKLDNLLEEFWNNERME